MSQTGYSKYETGENDVPTSILIELSKFYNTSVDYILGLTDEEAPYERKIKLQQKCISFVDVKNCKTIISINIVYFIIGNDIKI